MISIDKDIFVGYCKDIYKMSAALRSVHDVIEALILDNDHGINPIVDPSDIIEILNSIATITFNAANIADDMQYQITSKVGQSDDV